MGVQETSLDAYYTRVLPLLGRRQKQVYDVLEDATLKGFDMTNMEIARLLGWSINRVTPRVLELRKKGLVDRSYPTFIRRCGVTGSQALAWKTRRQTK